MMVAVVETLHVQPCQLYTTTAPFTTNTVYSTLNTVYCMHNHANYIQPLLPLQPTQTVYSTLNIVYCMHNHVNNKQPLLPLQPTQTVSSKYCIQYAQLYGGLQVQQLRFKTSTSKLHSGLPPTFKLDSQTTLDLQTRFADSLRPSNSIRRLPSTFTLRLSNSIRRPSTFKLDLSTLTLQPQT